MEHHVTPGARRNVTVTAATSVLAFVVLFLPQITAALNLTTLGKLLSVALIGLLTAFGQRLTKCVRDRNTLKSALRVWPLEPLGVARLETLGVYPARDAKGQVPKYQVRPSGEDGALASALRASKHVIVHGPPGCGKSRASVQAASQELKDILAVIPLDSQALRLLLDDGIKLSGSQQQLCLWLDGLDRFVDALDPCSLSTLEKVQDHEIRIVGTIRTEQWEELVCGSSQRSEAARALAHRAKIVELGAFSPEPSKEPASEPARPVLKPRKPLWDRVLLLLASGLLAWLIAVAIFGGDLFTPPSIDVQMEKLTGQILASEGPGGGHVVVDERVKLHQTEQPSWLLVTEDLPSHEAFNKGAAEGAWPRPRSDDLRIYDVIDGRLQLELHFRPRGTGVRAAEWHALTAGAGPSGDYSEDGEPEVVAGYALPAKARGALLPFGIDWADGRYQLKSLTPEKLRLSTRGLDAKAVGFRREAYETPITLKTAVVEPPFSALKLKGYRVQAFALAQRPVPRLLTGYFVATPVYEKTEMLEIHANQFRTGQLKIHPCTPDYYACPAPKAEQDVLVPPDDTLDRGLLEAWSMVDRRWITPIRVVQRRAHPAKAGRRHTLRSIRLAYAPTLGRLVERLHIHRPGAHTSQDELPMASPLDQVALFRVCTILDGPLAAEAPVEDRPSVTACLLTMQQRALD
jgi:hypothetical protein